MTDAPPASFVFRRPRWGRGTITEEDARFLHDLVLEVAPPAMVELGVASGCSSAVLLEALAKAERQETPDDIWLYSFDVMDHCYFDPARPVGAAVAELLPHLLARWRLTVGDALRARMQLAGRDLTLAFIDANHLHPWATADLLALLPALAPGAWVALHDIRLPLLGLPKSKGHGPMHLFEQWPGPRRSGGTNDNIGAIRLPADLREASTILERVLASPWEAELPEATLGGLGIPACSVLDPRAVKERRRAMLTLRRVVDESRPVYIWGTGQAGRGLLAVLRRHRLPVQAFVDRDPDRQGQVVEGLRVCSPADVTPAAIPKPFFVFTGTYAEEIAAALETAGWAGKDYVGM